MLNGTNFRHAVEFSRSGCARFGPLRRLWGNLIYATRLISSNPPLGHPSSPDVRTALHANHFPEVWLLCSAFALLGNLRYVTRLISRRQILR